MSATQCSAWARSVRRACCVALSGLCAITACDAGDPAVEGAPSTTSALTPAPPTPATSNAPSALTFATDLGSVHCTLFPERAPHAVALVTRLAAGTTPFKDARSGAVRTGRFYDGLTFFRRIAGVLVQTGCPLNTGTGHPGFRIEAELHADDAALLQQPGALVMARYHPAPNRADPNPPPPGHVIGTQLVITLRPMPHLAGELPVIGRCEDLDVVRRISLATDAPVLRRLEVAARGATD